MKKWNPLIGIVITLILVLFIVSVLKDLLIKSAIEIASPGIIGAKIEMGGFSLGLLNHKIHIRDFKMYNPPGFPDQVFLFMPEVEVDADIPALLKGKMHFPLVVFNMERMIIFKNKEGKLNVNSLKIVEEQAAANKGKPMKLPAFNIDELDLNIGQVLLEDYAHAPPPRVELYNVGIKNKKIRNINGIPKFVAAVIVEAIKPTAIRGAGFMAAETLLGVGFLPALAVGIVVAQDTASSDLGRSHDEVYRESMKLIKDLNGVVKKEDHKIGQIFAKIYGCDIAINIQDKGWGRSTIKIKARQFMLAKLEIANGLLYQLRERLR